jgi:hypothetical protein
MDDYRQRKQAELEAEVASLRDTFDRDRALIHRQHDETWRAWRLGTW